MNIHDLPDVLRLLPADERQLLRAKYGLDDGVIRSARAAFDVTYPAMTGYSSVSKSDKVRTALARAWLRAVLVEFFEVLGDYTVSEQPERLMKEFRLAIRVYRKALRASGQCYEHSYQELPHLEGSEMLYSCKERLVIAWLRGLGAASEAYRRQRLRAELRQLACMMLEAVENKKGVKI